MPSTLATSKRNRQRVVSTPSTPNQGLAQADPGLTQAGLAQRTFGNQALARVSTVAPPPPTVSAGTISAGAPPIVQRAGEKSAHWRWKYGNKIGKEKRSSEKSRQESEELVNQTPEVAAKAIHDILHSKESEMAKFERVAITLSGHDSNDIGIAYSRYGQLLNNDIEKFFSNKYQVEYLKDIRANKGVPSLRMMLYTALGKVTSSGFFSKIKAISKIPVVKGAINDMLGDTKRFKELLERADPGERRVVLGDERLMKLLRDEKKQFWEILVAQADVDVAQEELDAKNKAPVNPNAPIAPMPGGVMGARGSHSHLSTKEKLALAEAHETELIDLLKKSVELLGFNKTKFAEGVATWRAKATPEDIGLVLALNGKFEKAMKDELKLVPFIGKNKGLDNYIRGLITSTQVVHLDEEQTLAMAKDQQLAGYVAEFDSKIAGLLPQFESQKFYERVMDWKTKASPADIAWVTKPDSAFREALGKVNPRISSLKIVIPYVGLNKDTEKYFVDLLTKPAAKKEDVHVEAVRGNLERQGEFVDRGNGRRSPLGMFDRFINDKRFPQLLSEMTLMSTDQREKLLNELDPASPANALTLLLDKVKRAGMNKEERAQVQAMFSLQHGEPGGNYIELWSMVMPGQTTRVKAALGHLKPSKWSKMGGVSSRQDIGKDIYKALLDLDDEEYLQVRQDKALLAKFKEYSDKTDYWAKILTLLGMKDENDQVAGSGSLRKDQATAADARFSPMRFAYMFDDAIEEKYTMTRYVEGKDNKLERKHFGEGVGAGAEKGQLYVIASKAQKVAAEYEQNGKGLAANLMMTIYIKLAEINKAKALYLKEKVKPVHLALTTNAPIPVDERIKRAKKEGFKFGRFSKVNRQRYFEAFEHVHGRQLLHQWSNVFDFMEMNKGLTDLNKEINRLESETKGDLPENATPEQTKERSEKQAKLKVLLKEHSGQFDRVKRFTLGISQSRRLEMKALRLNAEDRIKLEGMVSDKIIDAANKDTEVQKYFDEIGLPYDEYMQQKMKAVDSLEMQRHLDTTRQWRWFATKGSQLKEGTRNVKGAVTSTENEQRKVEKDKRQLTEVDLTKLHEVRDKGAKKTETALEDREMLEARFRDMQASFEARAKAIFKLIAFAIVTGLTMGLGAPLSIGIHIAVEAGIQILETAYDYFVLKKNTFQDVAINFMMGVLTRTVNILTANIGMALNQSIFHPDMLGPGGAWVDRSISRSIAGLINSVVMFAPKHVVAAYQQSKELEKVIKEGEDTIGDAAETMLKKEIQKIGTNFAMEAFKEATGGMMGKGAKPVAPPKDVNTAFNDRMAGGGNAQEQQQMWGRYEKQQQKAAKKEVRDAFFIKKYDENEKDVDKDRLKDTRKEQRGKEPKDPIFKAIKEKLENNQAEAHKSGEKSKFKTIMGQLGIDLTQLNGLDDEQKGEVEMLCHIPPGKLEEYLA